MYFGMSVKTRCKQRCTVVFELCANIPSDSSNTYVEHDKLFYILRCCSKSEKVYASYIRPHIDIYMHTNIHTHTHTHTYIQTYIYTRTYIHAYKHIHTYIHAYNLHTHNVYIQGCLFLWLCSPAWAMASSYHEVS
jgi:hypothetical protein